MVGSLAAGAVHTQATYQELSQARRHRGKPRWGARHFMYSVMGHGSTGAANVDDDADGSGPT